MRTIIDLPEKDLRAIKAFAKRERISQAEALRRAVRCYLEAVRGEPIEAAFGLWAGREGGLAYQRALRAEWER
ncbi:MAG: CopG family transcriptional regulator [Aquisalimonadaceae bacterium]